MTSRMLFDHIGHGHSSLRKFTSVSLSWAPASNLFICQVAAIHPLFLLLAPLNYIRNPCKQLASKATRFSELWNPRKFRFAAINGFVASMDSMTSKLKARQLCGILGDGKEKEFRKSLRFEHHQSSIASVPIFCVTMPSQALPRILS